MRRTSLEATTKTRVRVSWWAALIALLLGWTLFTYNLDLESLWMDEYISWSLADSTTLGDLLGKYPEATAHPPGYFVWLWAWIHVTGSHHLFVLRLTAAIPALLAVALTYRVGQDWFNNRWVALGGAVFMATSGFFIYFARELRMYTLIVLLALLSWWLLKRYLDSGRRSLLIAYALVVALMGYTYYLSAFVIAVQCITVLIFYRRRAVAVLLSYLIPAVLLAFWLPTFLTQTLDQSARYGRDGTLTLGNVGQFNANRPTNLDSLEEFVEIYSAGEVWLVGLLVVVGLTLGWQRRSYRPSVSLLVLWFFGVLALVWAVNPVVPVYNPRYVLTVLPALALIVGLAVAELPAPVRPALIAIIAVSATVSHQSAFLEPKTPHNELLTTIDSNRLPGDRIWYNLTSGATGSSLNRGVEYYLEQVTPDLVPELFIWDADDDFESVADVPRVWDVRPYWIPLPGDIARELRDGRVQSEKYTFGAFDIRLYEAPPTAQAPAQFGDVLALQVGDMRTTFAPGETLGLKLWWRALELPTLDYSYALQLRNSAGQVVTQVDSGLALGDTDEPIPTSSWQITDEPVLAVTDFALPEDLSPGMYSVWLGIYYWENPTPLTISGGTLVTDDNNFAQVAEFDANAE